MRGKHSLVGKVFGNWQLTRLIGSGSYGAVYEAEHVSSPALRAAVKVLHAALADDEDLRLRFVDEATAAVRAHHQHCVRTFDVGVAANGRAYLVMELLRGTTLEEERESAPGGRLELRRALSIARHIAEALDAAHKSGVVHCDIKPSNILLARNEAGEETVKILDFGVAHLRRDLSVRSHSDIEPLVGTPDFMAPEQWLGSEQVDGRTDIFALGTLLYYVIHGASIEDRPTRMMRASAARDADHQKKPPTTDDDLDQLINRMRSEDPVDRPQAMSEVVAALARILVRLDCARVMRSRTGRSTRAQRVPVRNAQRRYCQFIPAFA